MHEHQPLDIPLNDHEYVPEFFGRDVCQHKDGCRRMCGDVRRTHPFKAKFYIASRLENVEDVKKLRDALREVGHSITYDWTPHGAIYRAAAEPEANMIAMAAVARVELEGVKEADFVVALLPGGRGTHMEMGAALALKKPLIIVGHDHPLTGEAGFGKHVAFYWHALAAHVPQMELLGTVEAVNAAMKARW